MSNILTIKTTQITSFRVLMIALKDIFLIYNITFTNKGINIRNVSDTVLVNTVLEAEKFKEYKCTKDKIIIRANMLDFINAINKNNYDILTIYIEDKDYSEGLVSYLGIKFENSITKQCKIQKLSLIGPYKKNQNVIQ